AACSENLRENRFSRVFGRPSRMDRPAAPARPGSRRCHAMSAHATRPGREVQELLFALALVGALGISSANGQTTRKTTTPGQNPAPAQSDPLNLGITQIPVNPTDPIAVINGSVITRAQLADECVARKGEEILETLIAKTLIEQALRAKKL